MMFQRQQSFYTLEDYFSLEETAEQRYEYYQGELFAMAGGSANHNRISLNVASEFNRAFEQQPCQAFMSDMRLLIKAADLYTYPDVMVVGGRLDFALKRTDIVTNPILLIEVLSKSTENYDRGQKFKFYRMIPTLQHYLLIEQDQLYVEYFQKVERDRWVLQTFSELGQIVKIESLDLELELERIYNKVIWDTLS